MSSVIGSTVDLSKKKPESIVKLSNNEDFNAYLEHVFSVTGSFVISPSILFIMVAENLTIDEFIKATSGHLFTVNDVAYAIKSQLQGKSAPLIYICLF